MAPPSTTVPLGGRRRAAALPPGERRDAIVAATIPLLVEHGEQVTTRQIAEAAGVAEGTIFRVFADKDAIVAAAVDAALDPDPYERALQAIDPSRPLVDVVTDAVSVSLHRFAETWRLLSNVGRRVHDPRPRAMAESPTLARLLAAHRAELAVPPRAAARTLRALTFAMSHPLMVERPAPPREIARTFLHGVSKGTPC